MPQGLVRVIRYVELNADGEPRAEARSMRVGGESENARWALLVASAAKKGHTLVRLCNHLDTCRNPNLGEIEGDGQGGFRARVEFPDALSGVELWNNAAP